MDGNTSVDSSQTSKSGKQIISSTGRVTRVCNKFAYVSSSFFGGVFVPISAAVPGNSYCPDLKTILKEGDIVHFKAIKQSGKNDCEYLATHVSVSRNNPTFASAEHLMRQPPRTPAADGDSNPVLDLHGSISSVNETFGFVMSDHNGMVFFPGSAYQSAAKSNQPARLNAVFKPGDRVVLSARPQPEKHGCRLLALFVAQADEMAAGGQPQNSCLMSPPAHSLADAAQQKLAELSVASGSPSANQQQQQQPLSRVCSGHVIMLNSVMAIVKTDDVGCVLCPAIMFDAGAQALSNESAQHLEDVVREGDQCTVVACMFRQRQSGCQWRALRWAVGPQLPSRTCAACVKSGFEESATIADEATQTVVSAEHLLIRAIKMEPEVYDAVKQRLPHVVAYAEQIM